MSSSLEEQVEKFLDYMTIERGASPLTCRNYAHYLARFALWGKDNNKSTDIGEIDQESIRQYRIHLSKSDFNGKLLGKRTQSYHIIALRSFLKWLIRNDNEVLPPEKIELPKISEREIKFLNGEQVDRLLNAPSLSSVQGKRDKAILEVLFSTGLRISELVSLNRDKIDLERNEFGIIGKGGRARVVFLSNRAADWIKTYLEARSDSSQALFVRHKGADEVSGGEKLRLTPRSIQRMFKKYVRKIKLPIEVTPHGMRHSFASDLLRAGADLRSVQEMLGHKNVATTQIYTHVTNKQLKSIHDTFHGKGR